MRFDCLDDWLNWQETLNPAEIDLGLERVSSVLNRAGLSTSFDCPLITVAGTNGKGSVVAMLEAMAMSLDWKVCSYTSPHIFLYNERIRINGQAIDDTALCEAFERIDRARGDDQLTYFEFGTLAAIDLFFREQPDLVVLEVGLGGRLDAVNIMDSDVSVLTSVAIDHVDWLGDNRESIGFEKAGIFRPEKPVICGERDVPESVLKQAEKLHCEFILAGRDYDVVPDEDHAAHWSLQSCYGDIAYLPLPSLEGEFQKLNAASAIMALQSLQARGLLISVSEASANQPAVNSLVEMLPFALANIRLSGRFQLVHTRPSVVVDVAHNLHAARALSAQIISKQLTGQSGQPAKTWAIVAMLSDKDISGVLECLAGVIDCWCLCGLEKIARGASVQQLVKNAPESILLQENMAANSELTQDLQDKLSANQCTMLSQTVLLANTVTDACKLVLSKADKNDLIIIFGSFYTVAEAMHFFSKSNNDTVESIN